VQSVETGGTTDNIEQEQDASSEKSQVQSSSDEEANKRKTLKERMKSIQNKNKNRKHLEMLRLIKSKLLKLQ
jgi:hypothetical protein